MPFPNGLQQQLFFMVAVAIGHIVISGFLLQHEGHLLFSILLLQMLAPFLLILSFSVKENDIIDKISLLFLQGLWYTSRKRGKEATHMAQTHWIWTNDWSPDDQDTPRVVRFQKRFTLSTLPENAEIRISADSRYKCYLNGTLLGFGPAKGDPVHRYYDTIDLASSLVVGENTFLVYVLRYPVAPGQGNHSLIRSEIPGLYLEGFLKVDETMTAVVERDREYHPEEKDFAPLWIHENVSREDVSDSPVFCYEDADLPVELREEALLPRPIPNTSLIPLELPFAPHTVPARARETFVVDAGEEQCAFLSYQLSGGRDAHLTVCYSECYTDRNGKKEARTGFEGAVLDGYRDCYTVRGRENESYDPFWFRTFRFLQITVETKEEPLTLTGIRAIATGYPLKVMTQVGTSDPSLSAIWDISLRTLRRCMHDTYIDCPYYEQLQYIMDTRVEALYTYQVSADDRLARKALEEFRLAQRPDGLFNCSFPNTNRNIIPSFSIYYILMLHDHMMYFGDRTLLNEHAETVWRALNFFHDHRIANGLVGKIGGLNRVDPIWGFIDWADHWMGTTGMPSAGLYGPNTLDSLLYLYGLQMAAELFRYSGDRRADELEKRALLLQAALRHTCLTEDGLLSDAPGRSVFSQHAQVFGVLTGVLDPEEGRAALIRSLERDDMAHCSVAMCFYLFRALERTGLYDQSDRLWDKWRRMVDLGCTTCVESEHYPRSECHAWGALALYELPAVILGVRPEAPGYQKIRIDPTPGVLEMAEGSVITPRGTLHVSWDRRTSPMTLTVSAPEGLLPDLCFSGANDIKILTKIAK